jgi:hypothetical protein
MRVCPACVQKLKQMVWAMALAEPFDVISSHAKLPSSGGQRLKDPV